MEEKSEVRELPMTLLETVELLKEYPKFESICSRENEGKKVLFTIKPVSTKESVYTVKVEGEGKAEIWLYDAKEGYTFLEELEL